MYFVKWVNPPHLTSFLKNVPECPTQICFIYSELLSVFQVNSVQKFRLASPLASEIKEVLSRECGPVKKKLPVKVITFELFMLRCMKLLSSTRCHFKGSISQKLIQIQADITCKNCNVGKLKILLFTCATQRRR